MSALDELHTHWPLPWRFGLAGVIFLAALLLRFAILPVDAGLVYLTFYWGVLATYYLCGPAPGRLTIALSAVAGYYFFSPPYDTFVFNQNGVVSAIVFVITGSLIGAVITKLQNSTARMRSAMTALELNQQRYHGIIEDQTDLICRFRADGAVQYVNDAFSRYFGRSKEDILRGDDLRAFVWPDDVANFEQQLATLSPRNPVAVIESRVRAGDGSVRWAQFINRAFFDRDETLVEIQSVGRDITELMNTRNALRQLTQEQAAMLDNDMVGILKLRERRMVWVNKAIYRIFGYEGSELDGLSTRILYEDDRTFEAMGVQGYVRNGVDGVFRTQMEMVRKDGEKLWIDASGTRLSTGNNDWLWIFVDITPLRKYQQAAEYMALHDDLTGLPNRRLLNDRLSQAVGLARRTQRPLVLCYIDLDGFKPVNDRRGHAAGDRLLQEVASRLQACVRENDTVCRLGGDEFVLMLTNLENVAEHAAIVERAKSELCRPFAVDAGVEATISASIGVALFPDDADEPDALLCRADEAMYQAKAQGRNRICQYRPAADPAAGAVG